MQKSHQTSDDLAEQTTLPAGIHIRPLDSGDRAALSALFSRLSPESRRRRFLTPKRELTAKELTYLTAVDHRRHEALAAVDGRDGSIVAVARYAAAKGDCTEAEAAVAVADDMQRQGIATALVRRLFDRARVNGFEVLTASTLWENRPARALLRGLGFRARASEGSVIELEVDLWAR